MHDTILAPANPGAEPAHAVAPEPDLSWPAYLLGAASLLVIAGTVSPLTQTAAQYQLDWLYALSETWRGKARFGVDVQFTYGPWGFVWGGYHPKTFALTCLFWLAYAGLVFAVARRVFAAATGPGRPVRAAWLLLVWSMLLGGTHSCFADARLFLLPVLLLLNHFFVARRSVSGRARLDPLTLLTCAAIGFLGTVKFSYLVAGGLAVAAVAVDELLRRPRRAWAMTTAAAAYVLSWVAAGQSLVDLPRSLRASLEVVAGYTEAMNISTAFDARQQALYIAAFAGLVALVATRRRRAAAWLTAGAVVALAWIVFRSAFVRYDEHAVIAGGFVGLAAPLITAALWPDLTRPTRVVAAACVAMALTTQLTTAWRHDPARRPNAPIHAASAVIAFLGEARAALAGETTRAAQEHEAFFANLAQALPLPPVEGRVDVVPNDLAAALANGLVHAPRPTLQGYSAYTPALARANAEHYASERRPDHVFFRPNAIDDRLPSLEDSQIWLELLRRYRIVGTAGDHLHLIPAGRTRGIDLVPLASFDATLGARFDVPASPARRPVWARIRIDGHPLARVAAQLYKPPRVAMEVTLAGGRSGTFRVISAIAADGFLLSPAIVAPAQFAAIFDRVAYPPQLDAWTVRSLRVVAEPEAWSRLYFEPTIRVELFELSTRGVDPTTAPAAR